LVAVKVLLIFYDLWVYELQQFIGSDVSKSSFFTCAYFITTDYPFHYHYKRLWYRLFMFSLLLVFYDTLKGPVESV